MSRRATTPFAILSMLSLGPKSGYDIARQLAFSVGHFWAESNGQLYPALRNLVAAGLATAGPRASSRRRRVTYEITRKGREVLAEWLRRPAVPPVVRNELLLKMFVGWQVGVDVSVAQVRWMRDALSSQRNQFAAIRRALEQERAREPGAEFWLITVRAGEAVVTARLAWCEETLITLRRLERRSPVATVTRSNRMNALLRRLEKQLDRPRLAVRRPTSPKDAGTRVWSSP